MKKLNIRNLALFLAGCLIVGIYVAFVIVKNILDLQGFAYVTVTVLSLAVCGLAVYLLTFLIIKENKQRFSAYDFGALAVNGGGVEQLMNKINGHIIKIKQLNDYIKDKNISDDLSQIEKNIYKIQKQLKDEAINAKRIEQAEEFFDYYMPLIIKILNSYRRIETDELTGKNATETKKQVSAILPLIKKAFEKELDHMLTDEMIDITTDIKVLESMLSKDGLSDKNNII